MRFGYDNRRFTGKENYDDGDFRAGTTFHYRQKGDVVWGTFEGGGVAFGTLVARVDDAGRLDMRFQYVSERGEIKEGRCATRPEILPDGRYRLHEAWELTAGGERASGTSVTEEIARGRLGGATRGPP